MADTNFPRVLTLNVNATVSHPNAEPVDVSAATAHTAQVKSWRVWAGEANMSSQTWLGMKACAMDLPVQHTQGGVDAGWDHTILKLVYDSTVQMKCIT